MAATKRRAVSESKTYTSSDIDELFEEGGYTDETLENPTDALEDMETTSSGTCRTDFGPFKKGDKVVILHKFDSGDLTIESDDGRRVEFRANITYTCTE